MDPIATAIDRGTPLDLLKMLSGSVVKTVAESMYGTVSIYLELEPHPPNCSGRTYHEMVAARSSSERAALYNKIWELAKMQDPRIHGLRWGELHVFDDLPRLHAGLLRLGFCTATTGLYHVRCMPFQFGEGGIGAQYFSLSERLGRDPGPGWIGYINGMGVPSLEQAGQDVVVLSDRFFSGSNIHVVYNPTHQQLTGNTIGFARDALRMKAVDGGATSKQAYLLAQLWLDYLNANPQAKFLQVAHSEGAVHLNGALRLLVQAGAVCLLDRIRVLTLCPAHFISQAMHPAGLQAINFVKLEDRTINPWGTGAPVTGRRIGAHVRIVEHRVRQDDHHNDPHDFMSWDYVDAARSSIESFIQTGDII